MNFTRLTMDEEIKRLQDLYSTQYNPDPQDRSYMWHPLNPIAIYFRQAQERSIAEIIRSVPVELQRQKVLDIGCGNGGLLRYLIDLGVQPEQTFGIDLMANRIEQARRISPPDVTLQVGNAGELPYSDGFFTMLTQFTVFSSILDDQLRKRVAGEMLRVLAPGGIILWYDMYRAQSATLHCLPMEEVVQLFPGMITLARRRCHPVNATKILRRSKSLISLWELLPGVPRTHLMILLQKP